MELHDLHKRLLTLEDTVAVRAIPTELELLLHLYAHGRLTSSQLLQKTRCSIAGFGLVKKRLLECGLIVTEKCIKDRRVSYLKLAWDVRESLQAIDRPEPSAQREPLIAFSS
jgi:DNA-binding MarR family transcriptional regulator